MKKIIFISVFLILCSTHAQDYWLNQASPTSQMLTRIQFADTLFGWAAGDSGTIIHTTNGGVNWVIQNSGVVNFPIEDMYFLNRRFGWAIWNDYLFQGTSILSTTNGGLNWLRSVFPDTSVAISNIYFIDSLTGFAGGMFPGKIFKTTNRGLNWTECHIDTSYCPFLYLFPKNNINFFNSQTGFACGGQIDIAGMIWKTTDSGLNWFTYCVAPEPLRRIKALSPNKIFSVGGDFEYGASSVQSVDSGNDWIYDLIGPHDDTSYFGIGGAIAFRTPSEVWVPLEFGQIWALSLDSGSKTSPWYKIPTPNNTRLYDAVFITPTFGWACGSDGVLLKYNPAVIGIQGYGNNIPTGSTLYQNYPNPFNPSTTIKYELNKNSFVRITVYDILGRVVLSSLQGFQQAGMHKFRFSSEGFASGVYFYKIVAGDWAETKRMVILK